MQTNINKILYNNVEACIKTNVLKIGPPRSQDICNRFKINLTWFFSITTVLNKKGVNKMLVISIQNRQVYPLHRM